MKTHRILFLLKTFYCAFDRNHNRGFFQSESHQFVYKFQTTIQRLTESANLFGFSIKSMKQRLFTNFKHETIKYGIRFSHSDRYVLSSLSQEQYDSIRLVFTCLQWPNGVDLPINFRLEFSSVINDANYVY